MAGALSHLNVVELCDDIPGAACGRQFAAWGASVTVAEPQQGSALRRVAPRVATKAGHVSLLWEYLAADKRSLVLDPADPESSGQVHRLLETADVFVTDWAPTRLEGAGLSIPALAERAVVISFSPFGKDGPYASFQATDLVLQALSGFMALNGIPEREPLKAAGSMAVQAVGVSAFVGALAALHERERSGRGQEVEVSCFEAMTSLTPLLRSEYSGTDDVRQGGPISGTFMFECRDGFISLNPSGERNWEDLLVALGVNVAELPPYLHGPGADPAAVRQFVAERALAHSAEALFTSLNELRIACGFTNGPADLLRDAHMAERGFFFEVDHPRLGEIRFPGPPARLSLTPAHPPRPAPAHPGDTAPGGHANEGVRRSGRSGDDTSPPLAGIRVVDLTTAWLGPYASMLLGDLGADVMKIESPLRPDGWRGASVPRRGFPSNWTSHPTNADAHPWNTNANFNSVNRNKRDLALNLASAEGKALFLRLIAEADILLENFTPRVMGNFGLDYETLRSVNPRLVMASFSGFGRSGRYRDYRANGATTDTTCGWASLTGYTNGPPTMMGTMEADPTSGLQLAATALVALSHARRTGMGQHIDGSMFETCAGYIGEEILLAGLTGENPQRRGNRDREMAPHGIFESSGDDQWLAISVRDDRDWQAFLTVLGSAAGLGEEMFATREARLRNVDELEQRVSTWTSGRPAYEAMYALQQAGVPAGVVQNYTRVLGDAQLRSRAWFRPITHPDMGSHRYNGFPWRFSRTPATVRKPPPRVGEDSETILLDDLGLSADEIRDLFAREVTRSVQ